MPIKEFVILRFSVVASTCQDVCKRVYSYCKEMQKIRRDRAMNARGERAEEVEEDTKTGGDEQRICRTCFHSHSLNLTKSMCD